MLHPYDFFDLENFKFASLFDGIEYVWEVLHKEKRDKFIKDNLQPNVSKLMKNNGAILKTCVLYQGELIEDGFKIKPGDATKGTFEVYKDGQLLKGATVIYAGATLFDEDIYLGEGTVVEPGALIKGPTIIGNYTEVRQGAYIRGTVIVGDRCVVGHTTEIKGSIMLNGAKAGHFAYIGDSILGNKINLGAGTKLANLKIFETPVVLHINNKVYNTGLKKFGAILGDNTETGCNSVTSPGTILGKRCLVYPNSSVRGYHPNNTVIKLRQTCEEKTLY